MTSSWVDIPEYIVDVGHPDGYNMARLGGQGCVLRVSDPWPTCSMGPQRLDQSVDVIVELERRAAAERKARRKTYGIKNKERVDVEEERGEFEVEGHGSDGLLHTDSTERVDKGFRITGGSTDVTHPIIDVSVRADENSNTDHDPALYTSLGGNALGGVDDSPGVCNPITDRAPGRHAKRERKLKTTWCELKGQMRKPFRSHSRYY